jgi:hypothetical protein
MKMLKWPFGGGEGNIVCVYVCVRVCVRACLCVCVCALRIGLCKDYGRVILGNYYGPEKLLLCTSLGTHTLEHNRHLTCYSFIKQLHTP